MQTTTLRDTALRIMLLADSAAMLEPTTAFARTLAGHDARLFVVPYVCGIADGKPFALDVRELSGEGAPVELLSPMVPEAVAPESVTGLARRREIDLIVVATSCDPEGHVHDPCGAAQLALDSPIPVMVLHRHGRDEEPFAPVRRLVVPLDGSARAAQALPFAARAARRLDVPVHLVMVIDPSRILPPAYAYDPEAMDTALTDLRETAHWALTQAERWVRQEGATVESVLLYGPVLNCIRSAIEPGDLVVMTTHGTGRGGTGRTLGSIAARMLETVTAPMVIIRSITPAEVVVDAYETCPWVEPLSGRSATGVGMAVQQRDREGADAAWIV